MERIFFFIVAIGLFLLRFNFALADEFYKGKAIRFKATLADPEFLSEAKKSKLDIDYVSGEQIEKHVEEIVSIRPRAKENLAFLARKGK